MRLSEQKWMYRLQMAATVLVVAAMGACAPTAFVDPEVSLDIHIKQNAALSASSYLVADMPDTSIFPQTTPRAYDPGQLCFMINVSGSGIAQAFADNTQTCDSHFGGLGLTSSTFAWGSKPLMKVPYGDRRFDLMAFPKHLFGNSCPTQITGAIEGGRQVLRADGRELSFPTGSDGPIQIASGSVYVQPGTNTLNMNVDQGDAGRVIGHNYGCRHLDVAPRPDFAKRLINTGVREGFVAVACPTGADSIEVSTDSGYSSGKVSCDPRTAEAMVTNIKLDPFDLEASEWNWYDPQISIDVYGGSYQIAHLGYGLHYSSDGDYARVKNPGGTDELDWQAVNHRIYRISRVENGELVVHEKDTNTLALREISMPLQWAKNSDTEMVGAWNGTAPIAGSLAESDLFDESLLTGPMVGWDDANSHAVQVKRCPASEDYCPSDWQGLSASVLDASGAAFDIFNYLGATTLWTLDLNASAPRARRFDLTNESWTAGSYSPVAGTPVASAAFAPAWTSPVIKFVRAQRFALGTTDVLLSHDLNLIAGGSSLSADDNGLRRAVIYRSFDGGKSWYQVYRGDVGTEMVDAQSVAASDTVGSFVLLERFDDYNGNKSIRVLTQNALGSGF